MFVDKVDEHEETQQSAEASAALVHPLLTHVQLLEVQGLGWQFFLWENIQPFFREAGKFYVRLDKIAYGTVGWEDGQLMDMIDRRIAYFSEKEIPGISALAKVGMDLVATRRELCEICTRSPRELVRLMNVVIREHNVLHSYGTGPSPLLDERSFQSGQDAYVKDVLWNVYDGKTLSQVIRLGKVKITNKDVQNEFKFGPNPARNRVRNWEDVGLIRLTGTRAAEGDAGGKPANEYTIADSRVVRMMQRRLYDPATLAEQDEDGESILVESEGE